MELPEDPRLDADRPHAAHAMVVVCRICLATRQRMISLHSTVPEYDQKTLYAMLLSVCLPLNERETVPDLPEQICRNCKWKLLSAYDLYETTLASDERLRAHTVIGGGNEEQLHGAHNVTVVLHEGGPQTGPHTVAKRKRPLNTDEFAAANDDQPTLQDRKKINLACVKDELPDDSYGELYGSSKINETSDALQFDGSRLEETMEDEDAEEGSSHQTKADDANVDQDPLDAFVDLHYQFDADSTLHVCGLCQQSFSYKSQCRMHIVQKHNPSKPFKCDVCFCTLTSEHRLMRHQIVVHGAGQINHEDVIKSSQMGTGDTAYTCPICRKVFNSSVRFKRHKNVHVVHKRPFKCEECLYRFATKPQLTQHMKVHGTKSPSANSPGPEAVGGWYECDRCGEMFAGKRARTMHLKKVHQVYRLASGEEPRADDRDKSDYNCIICQASFARETVLNTHMKMHELLAADREKDKRIDLERLVKQELQQQMQLSVPPLPPLSPEVVDQSNHVLEPLMLGLVPVAKTGSGTAGANNNNSATSVNNNPDATTEGGGTSAGAGSSAGGRTGPAIAKLKELPKSDIAYVCTICEKEYDERELLKKHQKEQHPTLNVDIVSSEHGSSGSGAKSSTTGMLSGAPIKPFLPRLTAKPGLNLRLMNGSFKHGNKVPPEIDTSLDMTYLDDPDSQDEDGMADAVRKMKNDSDVMRTSDGEGSPRSKTSSFCCELCHKVFAYKCYLAMHMRKNHDKTKPFGCKVCHYRFGYRGTLLRHQLIHSSQNVRPGGHGSIIFKCRICSAKFLELKQLNIHLKTHRKQTDDPDRKVQLIRCHECSQIFSDRDQFQQHMEKEHEGDMDMMQQEQESRSSQQRNEQEAYRLRQQMQDHRLLGGSSPSLRLASRDAPSSPLTDDLKLESRDEEDEPFLDDVSIIKIEPNFD